MSSDGPQSARHAPGAHVPALDGLRGLAVLMVMGTHFVYSAGGPTAFTPLGRLARSGWRGVDLFFVLSGYLITTRLIEAPKANYFRAFYWKRTLRIFPLYYLSLAVVYGTALVFLPGEWAKLTGWSHPGWFFGYLQNVAMALNHGWLTAPRWFKLNHFWSLAVEEHFYFVWPLVTRYLPRLLLPLVCLGFIWGAVELRHWVWANHPGSTFDVAYVLTPTRLDGLAVGGLVASLARWVPWQRLAGPLKWLSPAIVAGVVVELAWPGTLHGELPGWLPVTLLVAGVAGAARWLEWSWLRWFGAYSYGLYVWHQLFEPTWRAWFQPTRLMEWTGSRTAGLVLYAALAMGASVVLALISWRLVEAPAQRLRHRFGGLATAEARKTSSG